MTEFETRLIHALELIARSTTYESQMDVADKVASAIIDLADAAREIAKALREQNP
jgi:hypothetical protein